MTKLTPGFSPSSLLLDARPDQLDLRDREFKPDLLHLPNYFPSLNEWQTFLPTYFEHGLILDQGQNGACTGFALAALIQYSRARYQGIFELVSPRMLYHLARFYDEFPGENYQGSSCRGALKAWHRHGVCRRELWPYQLTKTGLAADYQPPQPGWADDALQRRLGVYYRVDKNAIADMQAALLQAGVLYVSASIHSGWFLNRCKPASSATLDDWQQLPLIPASAKSQGGHAFAIIGYTPEGFIVQNSWGSGWAWHGLSVLAYQDWLQHAQDAWVFTLGPAASATSNQPDLANFLGHSHSGPAQRLSSAKQATVSKLSTDAAYQFLLLSGRDGKLQQRLVQYPNSVSAARQICFDLPQLWLKQFAAKSERLDLALIFLDSLSEENAVLVKIQSLAPAFLEAGIYPLFMTQTSQLLLQIQQQLEQIAPQLHPGFNQQQRATQQLKLLQQSSLPALWLTQQYSASLSARAVAGQSSHELLLNLLQLQQQLGSKALHLHLIAETAGVYLMQQTLNLLQQQRMSLRSVQLLAPLCDSEFAANHWPILRKTSASQACHWHYYIYDQTSQKQQGLVSNFKGDSASLFAQGLELCQGKHYLAWYAEWQKQLDLSDATATNWIKKNLRQSEPAFAQAKPYQAQQSGIHLINFRHPHRLTELIARPEIYLQLIQQIKPFRLTQDCH